MSRLINVADAVYEELTRMKRERGQSYSEVIAELVRKRKGEPEKTQSLADLIKWAKERGKNFKGKREKIDHDLIAYGVSRDSR